jgi:hypothetical protein
MKFAACALSLLILAGCAITPHIVQPTGPSLDGGVPNSGVLEILTNRCYLVTPLFNDRYGALVKLYGSKLIPPMTAPRWITPTTNGEFIITSDGLAAFIELDFYSRQHLTP